MQQRGAPSTMVEERPQAVGNVLHPLYSLGLPQWSAGPSSNSWGGPTITWSPSFIVSVALQLSSELSCRGWLSQPCLGTPKTIELLAWPGRYKRGRHFTIPFHKHIAGQIQPAQSILSCYIFTAYIFSYEDACGTLFVKEDLNSLEWCNIVSLFSNTDCL